jgi:hypothetical protein
LLPEVCVIYLSATIRSVSPRHGRRKVSQRLNPNRPVLGPIRRHVTWNARHEIADKGLAADAHGNPGFPQFLTVLHLPAISSAIGAGSSARANCYGAKRL